MVNEKEIEPIVVKKAKQDVYFKFADVQLLYVSNFPEEPRVLILFGKHTRFHRRKVILHLNGHLIQKNSTKLNFLFLNPWL